VALVLRPGATLGPWMEDRLDTPGSRPRIRTSQPKLSKTQRALLFEVHDRGEYTQTEVAELFRVSRATVYRELQHRHQEFLASCEAHIF
jgi:DNA invertase Pin-like site-specific DNA recombinase